MQVRDPEVVWRDPGLADPEVVWRDPEVVWRDPEVVWRDSEVVCGRLVGQESSATLPSSAQAICPESWSLEQSVVLVPAGPYRSWLMSYYNMGCTYGFTI